MFLFIYIYFNLVGTLFPLSFEILSRLLFGVGVSAVDHFSPALNTQTKLLKWFH